MLAKVGKSLLIVRLIGCWVFVTLAGCGSDIEMVLDINDSPGFFDVGFPSDLKQDPGGKIDLSNFPNAWHPFVNDYSYAYQQLNSGYSPLMPLYMRFRGNPTVSLLNLPVNPMSYVSVDAPVQVIDIDPNSPERGKRFPLKVEMTALSGVYRPQGLLQVLPQGVLLRENTRYALVVLDSIESESEPFKQNVVLAELFSGEGEYSDQTRDGFVLLTNQLHADTISLNRVKGAMTWTTGTPSQPLLKFIDRVSHWEPVVPSYPLSLVEETEEYCVFESTWQLPGFQQGWLPYPLVVHGGGIQYDEAGEPIVQYHWESPFAISVPKGKMPEQGFPLLVYNHGTSGRGSQVYKRGYTTDLGELTRAGNPSQVAAQRGWAASGMGGHFGMDHQEAELFLDSVFGLVPGVNLNYVAYNLLNPVAFRDNLFQMIAERVVFRRLVNNLKIPPELCPDVDISNSKNGSMYMDVDNQVVMGQSLGSFTSVGMAATDPAGFQGVIATGAGTYGMGLSLYYGGFGTGQLGDFFEPLYFQLPAGALTNDLFHPIWALAELALSPANIAIHSSRWTRSEESDIPKPHVLIVEGHLDPEVTLEAQRPLLRALETDFVGEELDLEESLLLLPDLEWTGRQQVKPPIQANLPDGRTSAVVRYAEDGIKTGHYVTFQLDAPKHQYGCFLETLLLDSAPVIVQGGVLGEQCY